MCSMIRLAILAVLVIIALFWWKYRIAPRLSRAFTGDQPTVSAGPADSTGSASANGAAASNPLRSQPIDPSLLMTVLTLLAGGSKLRAINHLRSSGLGLAAARAFVRALEDGHRPPVQGEALHVQEDQLPDLATRAHALRKDGFEQDAVQLVCSETGMSTDAAAKFVRALR